MSGIPILWNEPYEHLNVSIFHMDWKDTGFFLSAKPYGEHAAIASVMTKNHGKRSGMIWNAKSKKMVSILTPGNQLSIRWRARLHELLGSFKVELEKQRSEIVFSGAMALNALTSICSLLDSLLPQFDPHRNLYTETVRLLDKINSTDKWLIDYLKWEILLLKEIGFGLDLEKCTVTNSNQNLMYISPKSGCAVSKEGAGEWASKLFPLPQSMVIGRLSKQEDILAGLEITGHFLKKGFHPHTGPSRLPDPRLRLEASIRKRLEKNNDETCLNN